MNYLKITLSGPVMYFYDQKEMPYDESANRISSHVPTKAAIIGILGCGLGYKRKSEEMERLEKEILDCKYEIVSQGYELRDFKRINRYRNTYFKKIENGKDDKSKECLIRNVYFLADAEFHVYIGATDENIKKFYNALANPYWTTFIGKYECVPTKPMVTNKMNVTKEEELKNVFTCV